VRVLMCVCARASARVCARARARPDQSPTPHVASSVCCSSAGSMPRPHSAADAGAPTHHNTRSVLHARTLTASRASHPLSAEAHEVELVVLDHGAAAFSVLRVRIVCHDVSEQVWSCVCVRVCASL